MAVYREAIAAGRRPLYVCYNRPLADHIAVIATPGGDVTTYHHLADRISRACGTVPDFGSSDVYKCMEAAMDGYQPTDADLVDTLIVDEGQDFNSRWADNLLRFLKPGGRAWWLEDPMQNLYDRPAVPLPGWARLRADINYRSPREIVAFLNHLLPVEGQIHAGSPLSDAKIDFLTYTDTLSLIDRTVEAVNRCIKQGFKRDQIAIVTYRGRESSWLTPFDQIGDHRLRAPTGQYDLLGNSIYTEGNIAIDSVHRFKGRAAPCVVLTEIDFETLTDNAVRRLFVGATRATMKLILVLSDAAGHALLNQRSETQR
jgi:superfamily I DNA and RNA helicase